MANENNKINELVADDDDPTAELAIIEFKLDRADDSEVDAKTYDVHESSEIPVAGMSVSELQSDLRSRQKTISRLQYDIDQLQTKWTGLEAEIAAREEQTTQLNGELTAALENLSRHEELASKHQRQIESLEADIRRRDADHAALKHRFDELQRSAEKDADTSDTFSAESSANTESPNLLCKLQNSERYADTIRQQLQDLIEQRQEGEREREHLSASLENSTRRNANLTEALSSKTVKTEELQSILENIQSEHEDEIRKLRFELGEAEETVAETESLNSQLTSDLLDARNFKDELERMLGETEEEHKTRIEELQKKIGKQARTMASYKQKLTTKSEAISVLLTELAKKSEQIESIGEIENVIHDIDERMSERSQSVGQSSVSPDRMTRVLIGTVDDRVIRFPLFKDRLTVGRTKENDIQLKAAYISRRHAVIETSGERTRIVDCGSKNGIHVNSEIVTEHVLNHGDTITIGNARFRYEERRKREN